MIKIFVYCTYEFSPYGFKIGTPRDYSNNVDTIELTGDDIPNLIDCSFSSSEIKQLSGKLPNPIDNYNYVFLRKDLKSKKDNLKIEYNIAFLCSEYYEYKNIKKLDDNENSFIDILHSIIVIKKEASNYGIVIGKNNYEKFISKLGKVNENLNDSTNNDIDSLIIHCAFSDPAKANSSIEKLFACETLDIDKKEDNYYIVKKNLSQEMKKTKNNQIRAIDVLAVILILSIMMNIATVIKLQTQDYQISELNQQVKNLKTEITNLKSKMKTDGKNQVQTVNQKQTKTEFLEHLEELENPCIIDLERKP